MEDLLGPWRENPPTSVDIERQAAAYTNLLAAGPGETEVHAFFKENPCILAFGLAGGIARDAAVFSKLRFSDEHVTDFAMVTSDSDGARWTFVELEGPEAPLFTRAGDPSQHLTHGLCQTDDWMQFLRQDIAHARRRLADIHRSAKVPRTDEFATQLFRVPAFVVVLGRESQLTPDTRARKATMNDGHSRRRIITYDHFDPLRGLRETVALDDDFQTRRDAQAWLDHRRPSDDVVAAIQAAIRERQAKRQPADS